MQTILTLLYGNKYSVDDVHRIYDATEGKYNYVCLTDIEHGLALRDEITPLFLNEGLECHWRKLQLFSLPIRGKVLYLDLDVVIQSDLDVFFEHCDVPTICKTYWKDFGAGYNSSVMAWKDGNAAHIYDHFIDNTDYFMTKYRNNDDWFLYHEKMITNVFPKNMIYSFLCGVDVATDTSPRAFQLKPDYPLVLLNGQNETDIDLRKTYDALSMHKMG
jgi:hypothetical protein